MKGRVNFTEELWDQANYFFAAPTEYSAKDVRKRWSAETPELMRTLAGMLEGAEDFTGAALEPMVMDWIRENGLHMGNVMNAFRLCLVGECRGPHIFEITDLIGREETLRRLRAGIERIKAEEA